MTYNTSDGDYWRAVAQAQAGGYPIPDPPADTPDQPELELIQNPEQEKVIVQITE